MSKRILLLLADGFELLEAAGFTDVFGWANIDGSEPMEMVSVGLRTPLRATFGFSVIAKAVLSDIVLDTFDALAVPGGFGREGFYEDAYSPEFITVIQHLNNQNKPIASVCVASLSLGKAGIVNGRRVTTYHQVGGKRKDELEQFGAQFVDEAVVTDGHIISSTGPGTGVEVAFELLELLTSSDNAKHIRTLMRLPPRSDAWLKAPQVVPSPLAS